ncbi:MAG: RraA family protein [bacterium]|nr:RraA family protein [bacterium]
MKLSDLRKELTDISTTHICDAYDEVRLVESSIKPMVSNFKMIGYAYTIFAEGDLLPIIKGIDDAPEDSVLIICSGGSDRAMAGEIFATKAQKKGLAGIAIDGFCRDISEVRELGLPYYAKGFTPRAGTKNKLGKMQVTIHFGGIKVNPGDIVFGDDNGIIVLSENELTEELISKSKAIKASEDVVLNNIDNIQLSDVLNVDEHCNNISQKIESKLKWTV